MATKKRVSYPNILKQALSEFDTSKTVDVKGPMLDPILSWDGNGELPIYKDAASILERYYFNEQADHGIEPVSQEEIMDQDGAEAKTKSEEHTEGTGTEQAGTSDEGSMPARKDEIEAGVAKEWLSLFEEDMGEAMPDTDEPKKEEKEKVAESLLRILEQEEESEKKEAEEKKEEEKKEEKKEEKTDEVSEWVRFFEQQDHDESKETKEDEEKESAETQKKEKEEGTEKHDVEVTESAIIEKLIAEMEASGEGMPQDEKKEDAMDVDAEVKDAEDKKKVEEALRMIELAMDYEGDGVAPGMSAKDEKEASGPMEDTQGAGTEQAGTGDAEGQIPDRKDVADEFVEPKNYNEMQNVKGPGGKMGMAGEDLAELFGLFEADMEDDGETPPESAAKEEEE